MNIDFIVSFIGENSGVLSQVFFATLKWHNNLAGITLHLVRKQVSDLVWNQVLDSAKSADCPLLTYELDTGWHPYKGAVDSFSYCVDVSHFNDAARTAEWCIEHCGSAEWCILSHFDVIWRDDIVSWLKTMQKNSGTSMVGAHCPIMLLKREAYFKSGISMDAGTDYDVGVALSRKLNAVGFGGPLAMEWCFHHMGGGGGYHTNEEFQCMRRRAVAFLARGITQSKAEEPTHVAPHRHEPSYSGPDKRIIHITRHGRILCGKPDWVMRIDDPRAATCTECLHKVKTV